MKTFNRNISKIVLTFILSFFAAYGLIKFLTNGAVSRQKIVDLNEAHIIQQDIQERFNLFLDTALVIGQIASASLENEEDDYENVYRDILKERDFILGLNRVDAQGKINHIFPAQANQAAMGKVTQNYQHLLDSFERKEKFWFSPPFKLYQGGYGFVFYVPIVKKGKLIGWIAPVISSQKFFEKFKAMKFFETYELMIKDELTSQSYFSSGLEPQHVYVNKLKSNIRGRNIIIESWRKEEKTMFILPWYLYFFLSTLIASLSAMGMKLHLQRKRISLQLKNISTLLHLTAKEALSKLVDIHSEYNTLGATGYLRTSVVEKDVRSITHLVEQIDLLQTMAEAEDFEEERFDLLPTLQAQIQDLEEVIQKKELNIQLDEKSFANIQISGNRWLLSKTVLNNCLAHCVLFSLPHKEINISYFISQKSSGLHFHLQEVHDSKVNESFQLERRLLVSKSALELFNGDIFIEHDSGKGMILKIIFKI